MPSSPDLNAQIAANVAAVRAQMAAAAARSGRPADAVRLVAVTKYVGVAETQAVLAAGCRVLGESRPQDLWGKAEEMGKGVGVRGEGLVEPGLGEIEWHLIGHLQRNKVRRTLPLAALIHSLDSLRLLEEVEAEARKQGRKVRGLIEVNIGGEAAKHGFSPEDLPALGERIGKLEQVEICGLMGMAPLDDDPAAARRAFAALRGWRERLAGAWPAAALVELSMGMSGDFEAAIEEGSTLVRVGSRLFEGTTSGEGQ